MYAHPSGRTLVNRARMVVSAIWLRSLTYFTKGAAFAWARNLNVSTP